MRALSELAVQASSALPTPLNSWLAPPPLRKLPTVMLPSALTVEASSVIWTDIAAHEARLYWQGWRGLG